MNRTQMQQAFQRAARHAGPLYRPVQLYRRVEGERTRGTVPYVYELVATTRGCLRAKDADKGRHVPLEDQLPAGDFLITVLGTPLDQTPDAVLWDGQWFDLQANGAGEQDALGVSYQLNLSRWPGDPPPVAAPGAP